MLQYQLRRVTQFWGLRNNGGTNSKKNSTTGKLNNSADLVDEEASMEELATSRRVDEDYVYYMLAPPWARHKEPILYL